MLRPPYTGHRRYSITHRAVQRLRELVPKSEDDDDETLRDRLDAALSAAEDEGKAIRTLDAMLGEPQTLIPIATFGDVLYAIIKEDTVVTVLPQGHGEEILQRGQAMEQRVAAGQALLRAPEREEDRWDHRRRWRKEAPTPVVIERIVRGNGTHAGGGAPAEPEPRAEPDAAHGELRSEPRAEADAIAKVVSLPDRPKLEGPVADALRIALDRGRRRAAIAALRETLAVQHREAALLPLWNELASEGVPTSLTIGDLIDAVRGT
jgi:hypothetical protein